MPARRPRFRFIPYLVMGCLLAVAPLPLEAQARDSATIPAARLTAYAKAWMAIGEARDQTQALLAQPKNKTVEAQQRLRDELRERMAGILAGQGMDEAEYDHITHVISIDDGQRKAFEDIVAALTARPVPKTGTPS